MELKEALGEIFKVAKEKFNIQNTGCIGKCYAKYWISYVENGMHFTTEKISLISFLYIAISLILLFFVRNKLNPQYI